MKKWIAVLLCLLFVLPIAACTGNSSSASSSPSSAGTDSSADSETPDDTVYTITYGHTGSEDTWTHILITEMAEKVAEQTDGHVQIEIYSGGTLGADRDLLEGLQIGTVGMTSVSTGTIANFIEDIQVFDLPYLFNTWDDAIAFYNSDNADFLDDQFEAEGFVNLGYYGSGFRHVTNSKHAITCMDDFKDLKIRVQSSDMYISMFTTLGANAVPMSWSEVITSLSQGTIDGQENPLMVMDIFSIWEVQKYLSLTGHAFGSGAVVISKSVFDSLPAEYQEIIRTCAKEMNDRFNEETRNSEDDYLENFKSKMEVNEIDDTFRQDLIDSTSYLYDNLRESVGDDVLAMFGR